MNKPTTPALPAHAPSDASPTGAGFTLIELLVVIAVMAVIAGMLFPVVGVVKRNEYINAARAEMNQIQTALDDFKNQYGTYPPANSFDPFLNPLYFELTGVTNTGGNGGNYVTLDGATTISLPTYTAASPTGFGVGGAINCAKPAADGETAKAKSFLSGLKQNRIGAYNGQAVKLLVTSVNGPDNNYQPKGIEGLNPFRYVYPGSNNPNSYDLWIQLQISGKKYLICNWNASAQVNNPIP